MARWVDIPGYESAYEVSDEGQVRSKARDVETRNRFGVFLRHYPAKLKTLQVDKDGYLTVGLCHGGKQKTHRVNRLVLSAFVKEASVGAEACHRDHDKTNNSLDNLCWGTRQENEDAKSDSRRRPLSTRNKLTMTEATAIRSMYSAGQSMKHIAEIFKTHHSNVWLIVKGRTWQA